MGGSGGSGEATEFALIIFGPIIARLIAEDRGDKALQVENESFLARWADHWSGWFASGAKL